MPEHGALNFGGETIQAPITFATQTAYEGERQCFFFPPITRSKDGDVLN